eukprot:gnl/TRDRNA2_/TRDRNA2_64084_c0_seq1.p1 gnl/TRDRNA2_/TRDRNA2_64084_c0~~gnl/TRDRNA2_/TRDRNA2_64084_c0_seq1.p1  ORF type:complete len:229 (+),score=50.87 gnl/TRDRNA2_/TRDRNA2_64084_c0_seq1:47-733(+)
MRSAHVSLLLTLIARAHAAGSGLRQQTARRQHEDSVAKLADRAALARRLFDSDMDGSTGRKVMDRPPRPDDLTDVGDDDDTEMPERDEEQASNVTEDDCRKAYEELAETRRWLAEVGRDLNASNFTSVGRNSGIDVEGLRETLRRAQEENYEERIDEKIAELDKMDERLDKMIEKVGTQIKKLNIEVEILSQPIRPLEELEEILRQQEELLRQRRADRHRNSLALVNS